MLDILFNPNRAQRHPLEMAIVGFFYSSLSILIGLWIFEGTASIAIVFLTTLSCLYVVQGAIKMEEKKEKNYNSEKWLLKEHKPVIILILALFLGFTFSAMVWSFTLPQDTVSTIFSLQESSVNQIRSLTASAINPTNHFSRILLNNLNIVAIAIVFAFFYGAGAVYILSWNASVMGFVIGTLARESAGVWAIPVIVLKYFLHGIPEMIAYIMVAVAGGILYFAMIKGDLTNKMKNKRIAIDLILLILLAIAVLIISAFIEVYISTLL